MKLQSKSLPMNWPMSHAKRVTRDNRKNPEYHVVAAIRKLRTDTNCPAGKSGPNHVKNEQHIGSEKTLHHYAPLHHHVYRSSIYWGRRAFHIRYAAHGLAMMIKRYELQKP